MHTHTQRERYMYIYNTHTHTRTRVRTRTQNYSQSVPFDSFHFIRCCPFCSTRALIIFWLVLSCVTITTSFYSVRPTALKTIKFPIKNRTEFTCEWKFNDRHRTKVAHETINKPNNNQIHQNNCTNQHTYTQIHSIHFDRKLFPVAIFIRYSLLEYTYYVHFFSHL